MLGRTHRFHGINALNGVYKHGRTARTPLINLRWAERAARTPRGATPGGATQSAKPYRVAVVVSRKVNKSAVVRNRIRRRVYAAVRQAGRPGGTKQDDNPTAAQASLITPGTDLVFTVFSDRVAELPVEELNGLIAGLLSKTKA